MAAVNVFCPAYGFDKSPTIFYNFFFLILNGLLTSKSLLVACTSKFKTLEFYVLPTHYLGVLYLSENKQRLLYHRT